MKTVEIKGNLRTDLGKKATKQLRKDGNVPCVVYGQGENVHFYAPENEFKKIVFTPNVYLIKLSIDGKEFDAIIKDQQFHPVTDTILHMDFLQFNAEKPLTIKVPVVTEGFAAGVKKGGKLQLNTRRLTVSAMCADIPDSLNIDVTNIDLGRTLKVGELSFENLTLTDAASTVIASVKLTRAARGAMLEGEEGAEGAEAGTAAGAEA